MKFHNSPDQRAAGANQGTIQTVGHQTTLEPIVSKGLASVFPIYWLRATDSLGGPTQGVSVKVAVIEVGCGPTVSWPSWRPCQHHNERRLARAMVWQLLRKATTRRYSRLGWKESPSNGVDERSSIADLL